MFVQAPVFFRHLDISFLGCAAWRVFLPQRIQGGWFAYKLKIHLLGRKSFKMQHPKKKCLR